MIRLTENSLYEEWKLDTVTTLIENDCIKMIQQPQQDTTITTEESKKIFKVPAAVCWLSSVPLASESTWQWRNSGPAVRS